MVIFFVLWGLYAEDVIPPAGVITWLNGTVKITRGSAEQSLDAQLLDDLFYGDTVKTTEESSATIFLSNGAIHSAYNGSIIVIPSPIETASVVDRVPARCPSVDPAFARLFTPGSSVDKLVSRGPGDAEIPEDSFALVMYTPGNTSVVAHNPKIVWNNYPTANWYSVVIKRGEAIVFNIATVDTLCEFIEQGDSLAPGSYAIEIWAFSNSDTLTMAERSLVILSDEQIEKLERSIASIEAQKPDRFTRSLLCGILYEYYGLRHEAIAVYKALIDMNSDFPVLYKSLESLYRKLGVPEVSHKYLEKYNHITTD